MSENAVPEPDNGQEENSVDFLTNNLVFGDPVQLLVNCFNSLYPELNVKIAYSEHLDLWTEQAPLTPEETVGLLETPSPDNDDYIPMDERDWTTGAMISIVKVSDGTVVVLDWEAPHTDNIAILQEILPRLVSNPYTEDEFQHQYPYRVAKRKLSTLFEQVMDDYYNNVLPVVLNNTTRLEVVHTPYDDLFDSDDPDELDDLDDDDLLNGGV